jgi:hypothetical protein
VDENEVFPGRFDPGMDVGHLREGGRIDRDLATRVPAEADGLAGRVDVLRLSIGLIHLDANAHV